MVMDRRGRVLLVALVVVTGGMALAAVTIPGPSMSQVISDHLMTIFPAVAAIASFTIFVRTRGENRCGWLLLAGWGTLSATGNAIWTYYELAAHIEPFPSLADAGYLGGNILAVFAIASFATSAKRASKLRASLDGAVIAVSVFLISWTLVLHQVYEASGVANFAAIIGLAYPVLDIIIVSLVVFVASRQPSGTRTPLLLIGIGLIGWAFADSGFAYLTTIGAYQSGGPVDAGWIAGDALIAFAAITSIRRRSVALDEARAIVGWRSYLPYIIAGTSLSVGIGMLIVSHLDPWVPFALIGLILLVVARQFLLFSENQAVTIAKLRSVDDMKNSFLRAVSHELRTPLTFIKGSAAFLNEEWHEMDDETRGDITERLVSNADRLDSLLASLLDLDRLARGMIEPARQLVDVGSLMRSVAGRVGTDEHSITVRSEELEAFVDPSQTERIVENLMLNAVKHTPPGTTIEAAVERNADGIVITVADDGPGLAVGLKETIFDPFVQDPSSADESRGTGIGLSLVAQFADLHHGRAWVEQSDAGGARFHVLLADPEQHAA
jgi:signal transduction histidine kinase